ncbi:MAG: hypothetical protein AB7N80_00275 [Bdellovibrionales bacterium]
MKTTTVKPNKMLFAILFAALAFDLAGRVQKSDLVNMSDLASTANEEECAKLIKKGIEATQEGGCTLNFKAATSEARVRKVKKAKESKESLDWSAPKAAPYTEAAVEAVKLEVCSDKKKFKTKDAAKKCEDSNKKLQNEYDTKVAARAERIRAKNAAAAPVEEDVFEIDVETMASDCEECREKETVTLAKTESPTSIAKKILSIAEKQNGGMAKRKEAALARQKKEEVDKIAAEKLQKDIENCIRGPDGKALSASDQLTCDAEKLNVADRDEAGKRFAKVQSSLKQMLQSGNEEDRKKALQISEEIARNRSLPRDVRETAQVMRVAGKYQSQILSISEALAKTPANSPVRAFHLQRLAGLNNQMQMEFGSAMNMYGQAAMFGRGGGAFDELNDWYGTLTNSMVMAISHPQSLLDQNGLFGRSQIGLDINMQNRWLRGISGDPLVSSQADFNGLLNGTSSGNLYVDQALRQQQQIVNGLQQNGIPNGQQIPGVPGTVLQGNGASTVPTSNGIRASTVGAGVPQTSSGVVPSAAGRTVRTVH